MALSERIEKNTELSYYEGQVPVNYVYTYGLGLEKFFQSLKKGEFLASRCPDCGAVYFPCRVFCERCFAEITKTFKVAGSGTVFSFTVCHLNMDGSAKDRPDVIGLIDIDGADGAKFLHLLDVPAGRVEIGMKVKPVLKPVKDRKGHISDIKGFK